MEQWFLVWVILITQPDGFITWEFTKVEQPSYEVCISELTKKNAEWEHTDKSYQIYCSEE
jgi:hypothetical protein